MIAETPAPKITRTFTATVRKKRAMPTTDKAKPMETSSYFRAVPLVIELHSTWLNIRQKGKKLRYTVTYDQLWTMGAQNAAAAIRRERAEAAKARKEARKRM